MLRFLKKISKSKISKCCGNGCKNCSFSKYSQKEIDDIILKYQNSKKK